MRRVAKLMQLFSEGRELVFPGNEPIVVWIAKLNSFEEESANHQARLARSRAVLALKEVGSDEYSLFQATVKTTPKSGLVDGIMEGRTNQIFMDVLSGIRADPEWHDKLELLELSDEPKDDGEKELLKLYEKDYQAEMMRRYTEATDEMRQDLMDRPDDELREEFVETYLEQRGMRVFTKERNRQIAFLSIRECEAQVPAEGGKWSHDGCDHSRHFLSSPDEVEEIPEAALTLVQEALNELSVPPSLARFTDALPSSSASSERSDKEAEATPSGPAETSTERGTTSS